MIEKALTLYGLIGCPVKHSFSPAMHNAAFEARKINARYKLFEIPPQKIKAFLTEPDSKIVDIDGNEFLAGDIKGFNVTVPYKEQVLEFVDLDESQGYLKQIKAVNTVVRTGTRVKAFNTDIPGFSRDLNEHLNSEGINAAILGAGGAARAIAYSLAQKVSSIVIFDIDSSKSSAVCDTLKVLFPNLNITAVASVEKMNLSDKRLLVNVTPVGMRNGDPSVVSKNLLHKDLFIYDIVYNRETQLLKDAKDLGLPGIGGLGMLLYQGVLSWEKWTGQSAPVEIMREALRREI